MLGGRDDIPAAVARTGAATVIFAVANADAQLVRDVRQLALAAGTAFKILPSVSELLDGKVGVGDVRDVQIGDLLGRHQIETDLELIAGYLSGKRVLVTGAGGSIGSELCRQLDRFAPAELMMLDRDESALHAVQLSLRGRALLDGTELILADLRDADSIKAIFAARRPEVVFHAAALKHLPLLERYPGRGRTQQRVGHAERARGRPGDRGREVREHLHRQGRQPDQRPRLLEAHHRAAHRLREQRPDQART